MNCRGYDRSLFAGATIAAMRCVVEGCRDAYSGLPRATWVLAAVCFVNRCGTMVLPFLMLYLTSQRGFSAAAGGVVLSLYGVGAGVGAFSGGVLTDRLGAKRVQVASLGLGGGRVLLTGALWRT